MNPYIQYMYSYPHKTAYCSLSGIFLKDYVSLLEGEKNGLYIHIPFCQAKCGYCNLFSVTGQDQQKVDNYLDAIERQSKQYQEVLTPFSSVFSEVVIGGGTPLFLSEKQLERIFSILEYYFCFCKNRELVVETAPNQTTQRKLKILKQAGASRISIGIQSFSQEELFTLKRQHTVLKAKQAMELIKSFEFPCVNMDFIYGIPGQTKESLLNSLKEALYFEPDEIFLYPLYVKHGAGLQREGVVIEPEVAFMQYQAASDFLQKEGFRQDSMRRFVKLKKQKERPFSECGFGTSLALGCGGRSYLGNLHFCTPYAITREKCLAQLESYENTVDFTQVTHGILLSEEELKRRYVIRHLLIRPGIELSCYKEHFKSQVMEDFPILGEWIEKGFAKIGKYLTLTEKGLGLSDYLGPKLISLEVQKAMNEWEVKHG